MTAVEQKLDALLSQAAAFSNVGGIGQLLGTPQVEPAPTVPSAYAKVDLPIPGRTPSAYQSVDPLPNVPPSGVPPVAAVPGPSHAPSVASPQMEMHLEKVPDALVKKIANDEYVDFHDLLYPGFTRYSLGLGGDRDNSLGLAVVPKKPRQLTEREWRKAFSSFADVYARYYPSAYSDLLCYFNKIDGMMSAGADWRGFDVKFRSERRELGLLWRSMRLDLETTYGRAPSAAAPTGGPPFRGKGGQQLPNTGSRPYKGPCYSFNAPNMRCTKEVCTYSHRCSRCKGNHPRYQCGGTPSTSSGRDDNGRRGNPRPRSPARDGKGRRSSPHARQSGGSNSTAP